MCECEFARMPRLTPLCQNEGSQSQSIKAPSPPLSLSLPPQEPPSPRLLVPSNCASASASGIAHARETFTDFKRLSDTRTVFARCEGWSGKTHFIQINSRCLVLADFSILVLRTTHFTNLARAQRNTGTKEGKDERTRRGGEVKWRPRISIN